MEIDGRKIGPDEPVYIIAEAGLAHLGSLDLALQMLDFAVEAGADAFKTQYWVTDRTRILSRCLSEHSLGRLSGECESRGITFLCTPHDIVALHYIKELCDVPAIKLGSAADKELIETAIDTDLPLIVSMGNRTDVEIANIRMRLEGHEWCRLECVSKYPTTWEDIHWDRNTFLGDDPPVGWSSHTGPEYEIDLAAVAQGASVIEKHIKPRIVPEIPTSMDMKASILAEDFEEWCGRVRVIDKMFGRAK